MSIAYQNLPGVKPGENSLRAGSSSGSARATIVGGLSLSDRRAIEGSVQTATFLKSTGKDTILVKLGQYTAELLMEQPSNLEQGEEFSVRIGKSSGGLENPLSLRRIDGGRSFQSEGFRITLTKAGSLFGDLVVLSKGEPALISAKSDAMKSVRDLILKSMDTNGGQVDARGVLAKSLAEFIFSVVDKSGLFYEAHLKQWAMGKRSTQSIKAEMQNMSSGFVESYDDNTPSIAKHFEAFGTADKNPQFAASQMGLLESGKFGLLVHGLFSAPIEIEFERDQNEKNSDDSGTQERAAWSISITTTTPSLGLVSGVIRQQEGLMDVHISGSKEAISNLKAKRQSFISTLNNGGVSVRSITFDN